MPLLERVEQTAFSAEARKARKIRTRREAGLLGVEAGGLSLNRIIRSLQNLFDSTSNPQGCIETTGPGSLGQRKKRTLRKFPNPV
jgi:hypothetical protein